MPITANVGNPSSGQDIRSPVPLHTVIAIPVRDEAERIGACLDALRSQRGFGAGQIGILLFLNNCMDGTDRMVANRGDPWPIRVIDRTFPAANAGWARREAMEAAAAWLDEVGAAAGVILTTDADSRVPDDWVANNLAAIAAGVDAVAGRVTLDPEEAALLPAALHARGRLEGEYEALITELSARLDPVEHDPWPCHRTASGATLAVRLSTYRRVGGMPAIPIGEDRAFEERLLAHDARVRHAPSIAVVTSGRLDGRAPGGTADTMRLRCERPESPCDPRLERLTRAVFRSVWRGRLRRLQATDELSETRRWAPALGIPRASAEEIARLPTTGQILAAVEDCSPRLTYRTLRPRDLQMQIRLAQLVLGTLRVARRSAAAWRAVASWSAGAWLGEPARRKRGPIMTDGSEHLGSEGRP